MTMPLFLHIWECIFLPLENCRPCIWSWRQWRRWYVCTCTCTFSLGSVYKAGWCARQVMRIPCWWELTSSKQRCPVIAGLSGPTMIFSCTFSIWVWKTLSWWGQTPQQSLDSDCFEIVSSHQQGMCTACLAHHHLAVYGSVALHVYLLYLAYVQCIYSGPSHIRSSVIRRSDYLNANRFSINAHLCTRVPCMCASSRKRTWTVL